MFIYIYIYIYIYITVHAQQVRDPSTRQLPLKAKFQCHPAKCLLPVKIMQRCGLATGPATVELLPYLLPY